MSMSGMSAVPCCMMRCVSPNMVPLAMSSLGEVLGEPGTSVYGSHENIGIRVFTVAPAHCAESDE